MTTQTEITRNHTSMPSVRTVAIVTRDPNERLFDTVLHAVDHEVVLVESVAHAYSHIKRATPDLIVVCVSGHDIDGCRLLSMLALDSETARIPVLTYFTPASEAVEHTDEDADVFSLFGSTPLN
jgi:DNA-binding response OmpR family regulator